MRLMKRVREAILEDRFPQFVKTFVRNYYKSADDNLSMRLNENSGECTNSHNIPDWVVNALEAVNIKVLDD